MSKYIFKWQYIIIVALLLIAMSIAITIIQHSRNDHRDGSIETEVQSVQLAVHNMMFTLETPIHILDGSDTRITGITECGDDFYKPIALTRDMTDGGLIDMCTTAECVAGQGTPNPVSYYVVSSPTQYWYCVTEYGNIRAYSENCIDNDQIKCEDVWLPTVFED